MDCLPFSREEVVDVTDDAVVRPRTWGAEVESAESVERERLMGSVSVEGRRDEVRLLVERRGLLAVEEEAEETDEPSAGKVAVAVVVLEVVVVAVVVADEGRRFRFTMLDQPGREGLLGAELMRSQQGWGS